MPYFIAGYCPKCHRQFHFIIDKNIENAYKKTNSGIITYRKEIKISSLSEIHIHYYIFPDKAGVIIREADTNHFCGMILNPKANWKQIKVFGFKEKKIIEFFSKLMNVNVTPDKLDDLMDSLIWDKFYGSLQINKIST